MDVREKLVELLREVQYLGGLEEKIADHLIAHGVTVQDEPVKIVIPEGIDENRLAEMLRNAPLQIFQDEPVQEWISVKDIDRLPTENKRVLVYGHGSGEIFKARRRGNKWYSSWDNMTEIECVSHWCELPQPPKGE